MTTLSLVDQAELDYRVLQAWLGLPYDSDELLGDLLYLHLLLGPVELDVTADFEVARAVVTWVSDAEDEPEVAALGRPVPFILSCGVDGGKPITENVAKDLVSVLCAHARDEGWENFPPPTSGDPQVDLKRAVHDFVVRYQARQRDTNPLHLGEVDIKIQPTPFGVTHYWLTFGEDTVPGLVRGGPKEALKAAKEAVRRHSTALGALL